LTPRFTRPSLSAGLLALAVLAACGGSTTAPTSTAPRISSVTPNAGSTAGGTMVTISGSNFAAGATVTIGGATASDVTVVNATTITAAVPAHGAGVTDVVVVVGGQTASLPAAFIYVVNERPVISAITIKGTKPREPANFADLDETIAVSAAVTDAETPVSQLMFAWSADVGTFTGTGASVTWTAPHTFATPGNVTIRLAVTETFQTTNGSGVNTVGTSRTLRLHDSSKEVGDLAVTFLTAFSKQIDPATVMRDFTSACGGTANELADVQHNQVDFTITGYTIGAPSTSVPFTGRCPFRDRQGDACAEVPAEWHSFIKAATYHPDLKPYVGRNMTVIGTDQVTAVFENDQWKLCASDWDQTTGTIMSREGRPAIETGARFKR
jgi:IPT/TIG domain